jgi:hypothetical protein
MRRLGIIALASVSSAAHSLPPQADISLQNAEQILQFDVMLAANAIRCSRLKEPLERDYVAFRKLHKANVEQAWRVAQADYEKHHNGGSIDTMLTATANAYGQGHPRLSCNQLGQEVRNLLKLETVSELASAMNPLLDGAPRHSHGVPVLASSSRDASAPPASSQPTLLEPQLSPELAAKVEPPDHRPPRTSNKASTSVTSGSTQNYSSSRYIKDF